MAQQNRGVLERKNRESPIDTEEFLEAVGDEKTRKVLMAMKSIDGKATVRRISRESGVALSTVYKKIRDLSETSWVREKMEFRGDGTHVSYYEPAVDEFTVRVGDSGIEIVADLGD